MYDFDDVNGWVSAWWTKTPGPIKSCLFCVCSISITCVCATWRCRYASFTYYINFYHTHTMLSVVHYSFFLPYILSFSKSNNSLNFLSFLILTTDSDLSCHYDSVAITRMQYLFCFVELFISKLCLPAHSYTLCEFSTLFFLSHERVRVEQR